VAVFNARIYAETFIKEAYIDIYIDVYGDDYGKENNNSPKRRRVPGHQRKGRS
jgi:hypothetical protein